MTGDTPSSEPSRSRPLMPIVIVNRPYQRLLLLAQDHPEPILGISPSLLYNQALLLQA